jgi:hypothetical protein
MWSYFQQFWQQIVQVAEYPVEFFQNIGNAVAGAIGGFFDAIFHFLIDVFVFITWLFAGLKVIFLALLSPITYFFTTLRFTFSQAFSTPPAPDVSYTFSSGVLEVFQAIPHWQAIQVVCGVGLIVVLGIATIKLLLRT